MCDQLPNSVKGVEQCQFPSVRDRRRAETVAEIKEAALQQLAEAGPGGFSLRGVARAVGMTVQSLYHYFANRDALLTVLVVDAHHAAADAVQAAAEATRGRHPHERRLAACRAFREWALANRPAFLLLYGTPVPGFTPLPESDVGQAAWRLGQGVRRGRLRRLDARAARRRAGRPRSGRHRLRGDGPARWAPRRCSSSCGRGCTGS